MGISLGQTAGCVFSDQEDGGTAGRYNRLNATTLKEIAPAFDDDTPQDILAWSLDTFAEDVAIVTAFQAEGMVIVDMAWRLKPDVRVITIDTGRLPSATYAFMDQVRERYPQLSLEVLFPDYREVEAATQQHGVNLFYKDVTLRRLCCDVRKVQPLQRALHHLDAWITGLRREQAASRAQIRKVEWDQGYGGKIKINPLADWTKQAVWAYIFTHQVPYHPLYDCGYTSIGCEPCARATQTGEDERAGRWWWEGNAPKECGLHRALSA
jgi:phosphoadenosine phosphosulfate reductase